MSNKIYLKITASLLIVALILTGCGKAEEEKSEQYIPKVSTAIVESGFSRELSVTGEVQAAKSYNATSELRANVASIFVENGDSVSLGQTLVRLSSDSIASSLSTAQAARVNAQSTFAQTQLSVQQSIESAKIALETAETNLENTLAQNEASRRQAEETLSAVKLSLDLSTASAQTSLDKYISSAYPTAQSAITNCDEIVGVSDLYKYANDTYERFLGVTNHATKSEAEQAITNALTALNNSVNDYASALSLLQSAELAVSKTLVMLNNSTASPDFTQATLTSNISTINTSLATVRSAIASLKSAKAALDSAEQKTDSNTSQSLVSAQAVYDATIAQIETNEDSARRAVESAKAALATAEKSAELSRIGAKSSLDSAIGGLSQAAINQDKLVIRAPFAGKIADLKVKVGDEVNVGSPLVSVEDSSMLKLVAYLSSEEVKKLHVGDEVKIASRSKGNITSIAPSADPVTKKYKVEILHKNPHLHPGEFVKLRFQIGKKDSIDNKIFLPITAINVLPHGSFVWGIEDFKKAESYESSHDVLPIDPVGFELDSLKIVDAKRVVKKSVEIGDLEGEFVEIVSGLQMGDEVVVDGGRIIEESEEGLEVEVVGS